MPRPSKQKQWDANVQAVIDAKQGVRDAWVAVAVAEIAYGEAWVRHRAGGPPPPPELEKAVAQATKERAKAIKAYEAAGKQMKAGV